MSAARQGPSYADRGGSTWHLQLHCRSLGMALRSAAAARPRPVQNNQLHPPQVIATRQELHKFLSEHRPWQGINCKNANLGK